jgi:gliding motility-associated transport system ATP-binding protein
MIEVEGLSRVAGGRRILDSVSFRVGPGEIVGFLGPNGAGKTTTLRILAGALPKGSGRARVAGYESALESAAARSRIGYLPERVPVVGSVPAREYVAFVARARGLDARAAGREAVARLDEVGLGDVASRPVHRLSKGERQRVGLAAALAGDPGVLLLDEPTSGMDPAQLVTVRDVIRRQKGRRAVLFSTHLLAEVAGTCERVVILHQGRVVAECPAGGRPARGGTETVDVSVRGGRDGLEEIIAGVGARVTRWEEPREGELAFRVATDGDRRPELARALVDAGWELTGLRRREASLEETYLELVAGGVARPASGAQT